jgi:hypothetical protein
MPAFAGMTKILCDINILGLYTQDKFPIKAWYYYVLQLSMKHQYDAQAIVRLK